MCGAVCPATWAIQITLRLRYSNTPNNIGQLAHLSTSNRAKPILKAGVRWLGCCRACRSENWKLAALVLSSRHSLGPFGLVPCCSAMNSLSPYLLMTLVNALGNAWDVRVRVAPRPPSRGTANVDYRTFVCGARYSSGRPLQGFCFIARCPACPWTDYSLRAR